MNRRRFLVLAVALVALNTFFWVAPAGFAKDPLRSVVGDLFGSRLIRAEVLVQTPTGPADYRVDRGVIVANTGTQLTLRELNGELVTIDVAPDVRVQGGPGKLRKFVQLPTKLRVTVIRDANGPVNLIQVEGGSGR